MTVEERTDEIMQMICDLQTKGPLMFSEAVVRRTKDGWLVGQDDDNIMPPGTLDSVDAGPEGVFLQGTDERGLWGALTLMHYEDVDVFSGSDSVVVLRTSERLDGSQVALTVFVERGDVAEAVRQSVLAAFYQ